MTHSKTLLKKKKAISHIASETLLVFATLLILIPIYYFFIGAFKERLDIVKFPLQINREMFTLQNFSYALDKMNYLEALKNTSIIFLVSLGLIVLFGSMAGFVIARIPRKLFSAVYVILLALMVVPFIGCIIPLVIQSVKFKIYSTLWECIFVQTAWNLPFAIFLYTGFMRGLPIDLEHAAYVDGCSTFKLYYRIFLPLLSPVTVACVIRCGIGIWNDYVLSNSVLNNAKTPTLMVGIKLFFGSRITEYGYAFAGIIATCIPIVIAFVLLQKNFIKGLTAGAVKG
jgi:raffinose/stachyose/melibiose transport system permease protein